MSLNQLNSAAAAGESQSAAAAAAGTNAPSGKEQLEALKIQPKPQPIDESELAANVVDIRRFSTHDGTGIRTTIFLKGCSLACSWCQNPETITGKMLPVFFASRCIDCGLCLSKDGSGPAKRLANGKIMVDITDKDADWPALVDVCPTEAIAFDSTRYTVAELVDITKRDRVFFGPDGGVTISGGEPLFRPHFAVALLKALQAAGINTGIETALNVRQEFVMAALEHLDQVYADFKIFDSEGHREHTGQPNDKVLDNLSALLQSDRRADVTVRTPLIPGITDSENNIAQICQYISALYPDVKYELLNYNPMAAAKYDVLPDRDFAFTDEENPKMFTKAEMAEFQDLARANGIRNLVVH